MAGGMSKSEARGIRFVQGLFADFLDEATGLAAVLGEGERSALPTERDKGARSPSKAEAEKIYTQARDQFRRDEELARAADPTGSKVAHGAGIVGQVALQAPMAAGGFLRSLAAAMLSGASNRVGEQASAPGEVATSGELGREAGIGAAEGAVASGLVQAARPLARVGANYVAKEFSKVPFVGDIAAAPIRAIGKAAEKGAAAGEPLPSLVEEAAETIGPGLFDSAGRRMASVLDTAKAAASASRAEALRAAEAARAAASASRTAALRSTAQAGARAVQTLADRALTGEKRQDDFDVNTLFVEPEAEAESFDVNELFQ